MASTRSRMCVLDLRRRFVSSDTNWILSLAIGHFIRRAAATTPHGADHASAASARDILPSDPQALP
ncbi:MAG: hypothetical protein QOK44_150 [Betaproteobacteria bacterium]|jgi:hypothetical protein|nr:hypothetical protein [Betaproteobacteria bacterium]